MAPTVLITGASQGIGRAIAQQFSQHGYNLVLAARTADRLEAVAAEFRTAGHTALAVATDVRDAAQVQTLVEKALAEYGTIDVLVNNAGIYSSGPVDQFSLDDWRQSIDTNLWGYIHTIHAVLPHFLERQQGTIVNLVSISGKIPSPYLVPYSTTKFAVAGLTQSLQAELAPKHIRVCGIYPSLIKSNFLERAIFRGRGESETQSRRQQVEQVVQNPFVEKPEDVAKAVWAAVNHNHSEVVVGSANLSLISNRLLPGVMPRLMRKLFQHGD